MKIKTSLARFILASLLIVPLLPSGVWAAELTSRKVTLGSSAASASTSYAFSFQSGTAATIRGIKLQLCTSPVELAACTQPASATFAGATGPTVGGELTNTWTPSISANSVTLTKAGGDAATVGGTSTITFTGVTNPNLANYQFYARITTYSDVGLSSQVDYGGVALSTATQVTVSGTMPESLVFCVGTSGTNCGNITGSAVDLGTFSPGSTNVGTSVMSVSTNASSGYVVTVNGTTLSSGANTIAAMGTQALNSTGCSPSCTSATGTSQFGSNVRANNVASAGGAFGADVSGAGSGVGSGGYNTANSFRFFSGDTVAGAAGPTDANLFTNSYLVNVGGSQAAGLYTATLTYICTATF